MTDTNADDILVGEHIIPLRRVVFSGNRYVADANFCIGNAVPLMIHGNARMFLALIHLVGEKLNGGNVKKVEDYGYSSKGKGILNVPLMHLGSKRFSNLVKVPIFDFTEEDETLVQGMIGAPFLRTERAAVDFSRDKMILGVKISKNPNEQLLDTGYKSTPICINVQNRVTIQLYFPSLERVIPITPSTVSIALTLHQPLFEGKVPMKKTASPDRSPSRTSPDIFTSEKIKFELEGISFRSPASFEDLAEYAGNPSAELDTFGMLGFDWMKEHNAILDYANCFLYFKP